MLFVRFKCPQCGSEFKSLRIPTSSETKKRCPKCGEMSVPPVKEDAERMQLEEKIGCSDFV